MKPLKESFLNLCENGKDFFLSLLDFIFTFILILFKPLILLGMFIYSKIKKKKK